MTSWPSSLRSCGNALIALLWDGNWNYVCCNRDKGFEHRRPSIAANVLDPAVWGRVEDALTRPDVVAAEVERQRGSDPHTAELAALDRRGADIDARRARLARAVAALEDEGSSAPPARGTARAGRAGSRGRGRAACGGRDGGGLGSGP